MVNSTSFSASGGETRPRMSLDLFGLSQRSPNSPVRSQRSQKRAHWAPDSQGADWLWGKWALEPCGEGGKDGGLKQEGQLACLSPRHVRKAIVNHSHKFTRNGWFLTVNPYLARLTLPFFIPLLGQAAQETPRSGLAHWCRGLSDLRRSLRALQQLGDEEELVPWGPGMAQSDSSYGCGENLWLDHVGLHFHIMYIDVYCVELMMCVIYIYNYIYIIIYIYMNLYMNMYVHHLLIRLI